MLWSSSQALSLSRNELHDTERPRCVTEKVSELKYQCYCNSREFKDEL